MAASIVILPLIIGILAIVVGIPLLLLFLLIRGGRRTPAVSDDQIAMLQETWTRLERMEDRLTNLETILIESSTGHGPSADDREERI